MFANISKGTLFPISHRGFKHLYRVFDVKSGGMGTVYILDKEEGEWNAVFQQMIAIKTYKHSITNIGGAGFFEKELNIWIVLENRNILPLRKIMSHEDQFLAVMPFCEESVRSLISKVQGKFNVMLAAQVLGQVFSGLEYAYKMYSILHLDIKPENVLLEFTNDKIYKISDWGISKLHSSLLSATNYNENMITETCSNFGTLPYMSPERLMGFQNNIGFDIYSCGVMFYEIIFGCLPFNSESGKNIYAQIMTGDYYEKASIDLRNIKADKITRIVLNCISPDHRQRYDNYADIIRDISNINKG